MQHFTIKQVADELAVSPSTVYGLVTQRRLGHIRVGNGRGAIRIGAEDLQNYRDRAHLQPESAPPPPAKQKLKRIRL